MNTFDSKPYCEGVIKFALQFGKNFSYRSGDIDDMEEILEILYNDYRSKKLTDEAVERISLSLGIYLGQVMLDNELSKCGYSWNTDGNEPCLVKNDADQMYPVTKVWKRIINGNGDNVKSFYDVGIAIGQGRFHTR